MHFFRDMFRLLKQAGIAWNDNEAPTLGAALAYYTVFSLAPLLLIAVSMAGLALGEEKARGGIDREISQTFGPTTGEALSAMLKNAHDSGGHVGVTILGLIILLVGASGVFVQLQDALNVVWKKETHAAKGSGILHFLRHRLLSFTAVLGTGFLLLVSLVVNSILAGVSAWMTSGDLPGGVWFWQLVSLAVTFACVTVLFALIFKMLPDAEIAWKDVWIGGVLTALLFMVGQHLIGLYLGQSSVASAFGAAGSLVVILVWVYYSAQIVLFGAEFTHAYSKEFGSRAQHQPQPTGAAKAGMPAQVT
jgi:membrane protein